jgi:hypothetical protein
MTKLLQSVLLILVLSASSTAFSQWKSDSVTNTLVVKAVNVQQNPKACSDGANGVIVVWEDYRYGDGYDLFAQHLDANGVRMWPDSGVRIARGANSQVAAQIVSDDSGGAYIVWEDNRSASLGYDIYAQRVRGDGSIAYALNGAMIGSATRDQRYPTLCIDGNGGAYAAWEDSRSGTATTRPDIYMNRMTRTGVQWTNGGKLIIGATNQQKMPKLVDDGQGGCLLTYQSSFGVPLSIWGTRVNSNGDVLWGPNGAVIYRGTSQSMVARNVNMTRDGNEFLLAWEVTGAGASGQDVYAQRLAMDSTKKWFSAAEVTGEWPGDQLNPRIITDDSGGAIIAFEDFTSDAAPNYYNYDISAVRILANGVDRMPTDQFAFISRQTRGQRGVELVRLGGGEFIAAWDDARSSATDSSVYAQRMNRWMQRQWPVANTKSTWGVPINSSPSSVSKHVALVPRTNGAIAVFADNRNGTFDIYAQLIFRDATLPIELASFDAKANEYGDVLLDWKTANEFDNAGFEVERRELSLNSDNKFQVIASYNDVASLRGNGSSSTPKSYSFVDQPNAGIYEYRIADIGLDGTRTAHAPKRVEVGSNSNATWSLGNAFPNPATSGIKIPFSTANQCDVALTVKNTLGQSVLEMQQSFSAGNNLFQLELPELGNGSYLYQLTAVVDGKTIWVSPASSITIQK